MPRRGLLQGKERESAMSDLIKRFVKEEDGATMVEYGLMVALIAVVCIAAVTLLGGEVRDLFTGVEKSVADAQKSTPAAD